jgi:phospholipid/cholesterol/gamma-HCH transport system substrate-binding protein
MHNLELGTAKFNENMEALKHNFFFRRYFKKQARQKQAAEE